MSREIPADVPTFETFTDLMSWCWRVRLGEIKVSPEARDYAKVMSHHEAYKTGWHKVEPIR